MPSYFVVQPDGRLARFSTVVDDFTALNMTEDEAVQMVVEETAERAKIDAAAGITRARECPDKWLDCLFTISNVHGIKTATERQSTAQEK